MRSRCRKFHVRIQSPKGREAVTEVHAETPHKAVGMAEADLQGWHAVGYVMFVLIVGRCARCNDIIEDRQKFHKKPDGRLICVDCHK